MSKLKIFISTVSSLLILSGNAFAGKLEEGIDLYKSEQYEKAIVLLEQIKKTEPNNADIHLWLSKCYEATFQLDKSMQETKAYQNLIHSHTNEPKPDKNKTQPKEENNTAISNDPFKLVHLTDDYITKMVGKRNPADQINNLKFIDYKTLKKILAQVPSDSESLVKMNQEYEIKSNFGLSTHEDLIILNKTRVSLLSFEIDSKKFDLLSEKNEDVKKSIVSDLNQLVKSHNDAVEAAVNLINLPVFQNTDPISFEYFQDLGTPPNENIIKLEQKKSDFRITIEKDTKEIKNYFKAIITQEKELKAKKEKIDPELLAVNVSTLSEEDRKIVIPYINMADKVNGDKKKLLNYIAEQGILLDAFNRINSTIKKIKPDYVINDLPLPKHEKLEELK